MDRRIFKTVCRIGMVTFGGNIFIHSVIGAILINGIVKGMISMCAMLVLLTILIVAYKK